MSRNNFTGLARTCNLRMAELNYTPGPLDWCVSPRGHLHIFVLQFLQQLKENIRNGSALVNLSRQEFSTTVFPYGINQIIQKEN